MSTVARVTVTTAVILLAGVAGLTSGSDRQTPIPPPQTPCDAHCNAAFHRCMAACQGAHDDPSCETGCRFAWEVCCWRCDVIPTGAVPLPGQQASAVAPSL